MPDVPVSMQTRGPIPTVGGPITLVAQADMDENTVVTFGTEDQSCAKCGATDFPLGWIQASVEDERLATVTTFTPMYKVVLGEDSDDVNFGDTLECASGGLVIRAEDSSGNTIFGKAMQDGVAEGTILAIPVVCCPSYTSS